MRIDAIQDIEVYVRNGEVFYRLLDGTTFSAIWFNGSLRVFSGSYVALMRRGETDRLSSLMDLHKQIALLYRDKIPSETKDFVKVQFYAN